jgi:pilus assembly protein CpaC
MMRLLLTILAAIGFAWAYSSARADEHPAQPAPSVLSSADAPGPREFGARSGDARIVVEAKEETWVRVSDAQGALVFMRTMKPGETYRVPDRSGLVLDTGNAKGLVLRVDGKVAPAAMGMVRRGIELNPDALMQGTVLVRPAAPAAAVVAVAPVEKSVELPAAQPEPVQPNADASAASTPAAVAEAPMPAPVAESAQPAPQMPVAAVPDQDPPVPSREALSAAPVLPESNVETADHAAKTAAPAQPEKAVAKTDEPAPVQVKAGPRQFAANRRDARIVIEAKEAAWLRVSDAEGKTVFMRNMQPGETYRVPNRPGLLLESGNAKGLALDVDGKPAPALTGMIRRGIELDPETLPTGAIVRRQAPVEKPAAVAETTPAPVVEPVAAMEPVVEAPTLVAVAPTPVAPVAEPVGTTEQREAAPMLSATLPGRLPSAATQAAEPVMPAVAPAIAAPEVAVRPRVETTRKAAPAAHVAPAAPQLAAPRPTSDAVKPTALAAVPTRVAPADTRTNPLISGANAVTPSGVINASTSRIGLEVHKGTLVRLSQPASTVFVADPEVADIQMKSAGLVYVFAKRPGETALYAVDDRERVVLNTTLVVSHNVSRLRQALRAVAPDAEVDVISVDNSLILTGVVQTAVEAENIRAVAAKFSPQPGSVINQVRVLAPNQVNLRVRVAEVSKETLKQFGINWESIARLGGNVLFGVGVGRDFITGNTFMREGTANTLFGGYRNSSQDINAAIDALATEGLITVLAEPNLTALSGETASFLAGGEFPIPIAQSGSNQTTSITVEFKTFGVGLAFTPHLLDAGRINLRVRPEVSQLSTAGAVQLSGFTIPALTTRRAETTVELGSGQSFVIAGLLQNNSTQDVSKVPLLGDLPVLGALFKSDRFRRNESELVIIVTPYIVRPISANRVASPTDGFVAPSDVERILGGTTYRQQLPDNGETPRTKDGQGLVGPTGFQLD